MQVSFSAQELATIVDSKDSRGQTAATIHSIASLKTAASGDLSFLGNPKYRPDVATSRASIVLLPNGFEGDPAPDQLFIFVENPSAALAKVCARIEQALWPKPAPGIHPSAIVSPTAKIAPSATIGPLTVIENDVVIGERTHVEAQVFIGRNVRVGADSWIMPGVRIATETLIHDRVRIQSGAVIGSDGFGYEFVKGRHEKVPQVGIVEIRSDVEIGANSTIDRARFSRTLIGEGTKIDNLVQIAHNVVIGRHCLVCAQAGISGSSTLEDYVILGGQAGIAGHLTMGKGSECDGQSGVNSDLAPGSFVKGSPCLPYQLEQRINVLRRRLPELFKRVDVLESEIAEAKKASASVTVR